MNSWRHDNMRKCTPVYMRPRIEPISKFPHRSCAFHVTSLRYLRRKQRQFSFHIASIWEKCVYVRFLCWNEFHVASHVNGPLVFHAFNNDIGSFRDFPVSKCFQQLPTTVHLSLKREFGITGQRSQTVSNVAEDRLTSDPRPPTNRQ